MSAKPPFTFGEHPATDDSTPLRFVIPDGITTAESLFAALEEGLRFPGYFGRNWNALSDCLRDFHWAPERRIVLVHRELPKLSDDELAIYVDVLAHAVEDWRHDAQQEAHELEVAFPAATELRVRRLLRHRDRDEQARRALVRADPVTTIELKPGLQRIGLADPETTRRQAEQAGFTTFVLPAEGVVDRESYFDAIRATLPLDPPLASSRSWNAMSDSLWEGLYTHPARRIAILWPNTAPMATSASADFEIALDVLAEVATLLADPRATQENPKEVVVLVE